MSKKCGAEGLANFIVEEQKPERKVPRVRMNQVKIVLIFIVIQLGFIYLVSEVLWPRIMPKLFKSAVEKLGFLPVLGLSVIGHLLL